MFCLGKEIKGLRGGVPRYAAQAGPRIDTARAKKNRFRMKTRLGSLINATKKPASCLRDTGFFIITVLDRVVLAAPRRNGGFC